MNYKNYNQRVMAAARDLSLLGRVRDENFFAEQSNFTCQDSIRLSGKIVDSRFESALFEGDGCLLSQGCTAILVQGLVGLDVDLVAQWSEKEFRDLCPLAVGPAREECYLLGWKVLRQGLRDWLAKSRC